MRVVKLLFSILFGLLTLSGFFQFVAGAAGLWHQVAVSDSPEAAGQLTGGVLFTIAFGAISVNLWRSAAKDAAKESGRTRNEPPIPEAYQDKEIQP